MIRRPVALATASLLLLATACGGADTTTDPTEAAATTAATPVAAATATETPADEVTTSEAPTSEASAGDTPIPADQIQVTGVDYAFEGLPDTVPVGTSVQFTNASDVEAHELVLVRLPDDETRPVEEVWPTFEPTGEPALVSVAAPGEDGQVFVGDGVLTEPGRYIAICFLPVGADPEEILQGDGPPESDAPPHAAEGMVAEVTVA